MVRIAAFVAVFIAGAAIIAMTFLSFGRGSQDGEFAECRAGQVAGGDLGGAFELVNGQGQTVTDKEVITEPTLIYFGYTFCPDVCPLDVDRNAAAVEIVEARGQSVTPVFITIDPARDTPEVVRDFAAAMHPKMIGLTGSPEQVRTASKAYRTFYKAHPPVDGEYLVDHSTFSYLVLPDRGFVDFFRRELSAEDMADKIGCYIDRI